MRDCENRESCEAVERHGQDVQGLSVNSRCCMWHTASLPLLPPAQL